MALLVVQAAGGIRAYLCECGGQTTWTNVDHCHGPHSSDCHHPSSDLPQSHDEHSGDRQDHQQIVQELQLRSVEGFQLPALIPVLLTWLPEGFEVLDLAKPSVIVGSPVRLDASPPQGVLVARAVVFLV